MDKNFIGLPIFPINARNAIAIHSTILKNEKCLFYILHTFNPTF